MSGLQSVLVLPRTEFRMEGRANGLAKIKCSFANLAIVVAALGVVK